MSIDISQFRLELLAPELVLVLIGFAVLLIGVFLRTSGSRSLVGLLTLIGIAGSMFYTTKLAGITAEGFNGAIHIDGFSVFFETI